MLKQSWETYRGWAKRARGLQAETDFWNVLALVCVVVAALCGAATTIFPKPSVLGPSLAIAAALASAAGAYFGKTVVDSGKEAGWAQARATAEAIKSESFRYTARRPLFTVQCGQDVPRPDRRVRRDRDRRGASAVRRPNSGQG